MTYQKLILAPRSCKNKCYDYPKFSKWFSSTHEYCTKCQKAIPRGDIVNKNRCPCCGFCVRFASTWTQAKKLRSLQVTKIK